MLWLVMFPIPLQSSISILRFPRKTSSDFLHFDCYLSLIFFCLFFVPLLSSFDSFFIIRDAFLTEEIDEMLLI